jgi:hypothetical protein
VLEWRDETLALLASLRDARRFGVPASVGRMAASARLSERWRRCPDIRISPPEGGTPNVVRRWGRAQRWHFVPKAGLRGTFAWNNAARPFRFPEPRVYSGAALQNVRNSIARLSRGERSRSYRRHPHSTSSGPSAPSAGSGPSASPMLTESRFYTRDENWRTFHRPVASQSLWFRWRRCAPSAGSGPSAPGVSRGPHSPCAVRPQPLRGLSGPLYSEHALHNVQNSAFQHRLTRLAWPSLAFVIPPSPNRAMCWCRSKTCPPRSPSAAAC